MTEEEIIDEEWQRWADDYMDISKIQKSHDPAQEFNTQLKNFLNTPRGNNLYNGLFYKRKNRQRFYKHLAEKYQLKRKTLKPGKLERTPTPGRINLTRRQAQRMNLSRNLQLEPPRQEIMNIMKEQIDKLNLNEIIEMRKLLKQQETILIQYEKKKFKVNQLDRKIAELQAKKEALLKGMPKQQ